MAVYFLFFVKNLPTESFSNFSRSFSTFSPSRKLFRRRNIFGNSSWRRRDSNGPKIVEIGAMLTIFRPFEVCRKVSVDRSHLNLLQGYKKQMAIQNFEDWFLLGSVTTEGVNFSTLRIQTKLKILVFAWECHNKGVKFS